MAVGAQALPINIIFRASSLDQAESAKIVFRNAKAGEWHFVLEGRGSLPTVMEVQSYTRCSRLNYVGLAVSQAWT